MAGGELSCRSHTPPWTLTDLRPLGSFVEFESANDLKTAVEKLDGREFKGSRVTCVADVGIP